MIRNISFLLTVLLVSSCGTLSNSQFSKRKHLKGHFWNLKEKYKNSNSDQTSEVYSVSKTDRVKSKNTTELSTATPEDNELEITSQESIVSKERENPVFESSVEIQSEDEQDDPNVENDALIKTSEAEQQKSASSNSAYGVFAFTLVFLGIILGLGIVGLIITLFLRIFSTIIPWLFYASLIVVGASVATFFILLLIVFIFDL